MHLTTIIEEKNDTVSTNIIRLFLWLFYSVNNHDHKRQIIFTRLVLKWIGEHNANLLNREFEKFSKSQHPIDSICQPITASLSYDDRLLLTFFFATLLFCGENHTEDSILFAIITEKLHLHQEDVNHFPYIFQHEQSIASHHPDIVSFGPLFSSTDLCFVRAKSRGIFVRIQETIIMLSFFNQDILYQNKIIPEFDPIVLEKSSYVDIGQYRLPYSKIKYQFTQKSQSLTLDYYLRNVNGCIELSPDESESYLAKLQHKGNRAIVTEYHSSSPLILSGKKISRKFKELSFYIEESIAILGLSGEIQFFYSRENDPIHAIKSYKLSLHKLQSVFPKESRILLLNLFPEHYVNIRHYTGKIIHNNKPAECVFVVQNNDQILIGSHILRIDLTEGRRTIHPIFFSQLRLDNITSLSGSLNDHIIYDVSFSARAGEMTAIMGPTGSGKSTLLNLILGNTKRLSGKIKANGHLLKNGLKDIRHCLGYVPQDDLLIEELSVGENIFFRYNLVFPDKITNSKAIAQKINVILNKVGLSHKKSSRVGNPLARILSGGERKRLNIALELIREPDILILDEPTSGLSSQDAFDILSLLRAYANRGKIVILVVHQPSTNLYKLFDKILILNHGRLTYFGNALQALQLFRDVDKDITGQTEYIECPTCHNVNPDLLMHSLKSESLSFWSTLRKIGEIFSHKRNLTFQENDIKNLIPKPEQFGWQQRFSQFFIQLQRSALSKSRDRVNLLVTLLLSPALSIFAAWLMRSRESIDYSITSNNNYPIFLFVVSIVAIFFGITNSANEIIKDKPTLKRETLLEISVWSYFAAKFMVLMVFALLQSILFIVPAHLILQEYYMIWTHIWMMTIIASGGIAFGLLFSTIVKSSIAAYNLAPIILVPQIILGGALVEYNRLNPAIMLFRQQQTTPVPPPADLMLTRWAFEMLVAANIDKHPYEQSYQEEKNAIANIDALYATKTINRKEKFIRRRIVGEEYYQKREKYKSQYNESIQSLGILTPGFFLAPRNDTFCRLFGGIFNHCYLEKTWARNLFFILVYIALLSFLAFAILQYKLKKGF